MLWPCVQYGWDEVRAWNNKQSIFLLGSIDGIKTESLSKTRDNPKQEEESSDAKAIWKHEFFKCPIYTFSKRVSKSHFPRRKSKGVDSFLFQIFIGADPYQLMCIQNEDDAYGWLLLALNTNTQLLERLCLHTFSGKTILMEKRLTTLDQ